MKIIKCIAVIIPLLIVGCSDSGDAPTSQGTTDPPADMSFATDIRPIIQGNNCLNAGCHGVGSTSGGFSFGTASYASVINASDDHGPIIVAGNASSSNFYLKVTSSPPFLARMPLGFSALSTTNINKIRDWINQGALDN